MGKQNMPETLDEFQDIKYNKDKVKDYELLRKSIRRRLVMQQKLF